MLNTDLEEDLKRLSTAFHEAGHVAVAVPQKFTIRRVTIERQPDCLGITQFASGLTQRIATALADGKYTPDLRDMAERYILVVLAGPIAQQRQTGQENPIGASGDLEITNQLLLSMAGDCQEATYYYNWLRVRAERQVEQQWEQIERIAAALYEEVTLEEDRLKAILQVCSGERRSPTPDRIGSPLLAEGVGERSVSAPWAATASIGRCSSA